MNVIDFVINNQNEEFSLAICGEESIKSLARLEKICFPSDFWSEISFSEAFLSPACTIFALYNKSLSEIVSYGVIYLAADEGDIANIATLPQYRKTGLGKALLSKMLDFALEKGTKQIFLEVRESNTAARALYLAEGFCEVGKRKNYYVNPREDAVIMEKVLYDNSCN